MPHVQSSFLATAVTVDQTGLVNVLGAFIEITNAQQLPIRQQVWFCARLELGPDDIGTVVPMALIVEHDDGSERLARLDSIVDFSAPPAGVDPDIPISSQILMPLMLEFRREGLYHVRLLLNGDEVTDRLLKVRQILPTI